MLLGVFGSEGLLILGVFASEGLLILGVFASEGLLLLGVFASEVLLLLRFVGNWGYLHFRAFAIVGFCPLEVSSVARFKGIMGSDPMAVLGA